MTCPSKLIFALAVDSRVAPLLSVVLIAAFAEIPLPMVAVTFAESPVGDVLPMLIARP